MFTTRFEPLANVNRELHRLQSEMDRLFGRYSNSGPQFGASVYPAVNIWEDDDHLYVEAELPGVELDDLEIYVTGGNQLSLKGQRKQPALENGMWHRQERGLGTFARIIELSVDVISDEVSAEFKHGVLTITLPKSEDVKPRRIEVKSS